MELNHHGLADASLPVTHETLNIVGTRAGRDAEPLNLVGIAARRDVGPQSRDLSEKPPGYDVGSQSSFSALASPAEFESNIGVSRSEASPTSSNLQNSVLSVMEFWNHSPKTQMVVDAGIGVATGLIQAKWGHGLRLDRLAKSAAITGAAVGLTADVVPAVTEKILDPASDLTWTHIAIGATTDAMLAGGAALGARFGTVSRFHPGDLYDGIPRFRRDGFLPEGIHQASWTEFTSRYGVNEHRRDKFPGLLDALHDLKDAGVKEAYLGGSFVTRKQLPNDFDIAFKGSWSEYHNKMPIIIEREWQKEAYGGEMLDQETIDFFRQNGRSGKSIPIGVVKIDMNSLPVRDHESPAAAVLERHKDDRSLFQSFSAFRRFFLD